MAGAPEAWKPRPFLAACSRSRHCCCVCLRHAEFAHPRLQVAIAQASWRHRMGWARSATQFKLRMPGDRRCRWSAGSWSWCGVIDVLDREVKLVLVPLRVAAELAAALRVSEASVPAQLRAPFPLIAQGRIVNDVLD